MSRMITSATAHPRPIQIERTPGHPPVNRYSTAMEPGHVLRAATAGLSDDETIALARALGVQVSI
jgi:hypothetical protein